MRQVFVTNTSDTSLADRCGGVAYVFPAGETVEVPFNVAEHIFGHGFEDKEQFLVRLGWIKFNTDVPAALERLAKFLITDEAPKQDRYLPSAVGVVSLPVEKRVERTARSARAA